MSSFLYSIFVFPFLWLISKLPFWVLYRISDLLYLLINYIFKYRKSVILNNLRKSFPNLSETEYQRICKANYRHLCDLAVEIVKLITISQKEINKRSRFENLEILEKAYSEDRSVVAYMAHYNNWEWIPSIDPQISLQAISIYHPMENRDFDKLFINLRSKFGLKLFTMKDAFRGIIDLKRNKIKYMAGFIADQTPPTSDNRLWINFLNQETCVMIGAEKVARKNNDVVVYLKTEKIKRGYYVTTIVPMNDQPSTTDEYQLTLQYHQLLEAQIKAHPEYWLFTHRRWKRKRPVDEKLIKTITPTA